MAMTNQDIIIFKGILNKNERTILIFYRSQKEALLNFIDKQINDRVKSEEILQDSFMDFIENLRDFRAESSLKTFLYSIARNKTIDFIRKKKIKKIPFSAIPSYIIEKVTTIFFDEELEKKEVAQKINNVFERLPNDYRLVLRLKYIEHERVKTIAEKLKLSFKATESLIFRARQAFIKVFRSLP